VGAVGYNLEIATLRKEHRSKLLKNNVLRRISGIERQEIEKGWRKLHNLFSLPDEEFIHNLVVNVKDQT
jgi:CRISPR/Cas system endoribonuclease Cas6 (RAMP superfamily)